MECPHSDRLQDEEEIHATSSALFQSLLQRLGQAMEGEDLGPRKAGTQSCQLCVVLTQNTHPEERIKCLFPDDCFERMNE